MKHFKKARMTPLIKITILKVLLMFMFFTNVFKILYNFVQTSVTVNNYFEKTIINLLLNS